MAASDVNLQNDSVAADISRRARDEEDALDRAVRRSVAPAPVDDSDIFGDPGAPAAGSPSAGGDPGARPTDPEGRPLIGWDVLAAPVTGIVRGAAEAVDTVGDLIGQDFDLSGAVDDAAEGTVFELDTPADHLVGSLSQFAVPFGAAFKGLKMINFMQKGWRASAAAGVIADFAAFDPDEGRLSDLINEHFTALQNPVTEWLATDEEDTALEGRMKNAVEGLGLGLVGEALARSFRGSKAIKGAVDDLNFKTTPEDFAKIGPEFRTDLFAQAENVKVARERVDILMSAREQLMALDEADPAFIKAREYLLEKARRSRSAREGLDVDEAASTFRKRIVDDRGESIGRITGELTTKYDSPAGSVQIVNSANNGARGKGHGTRAYRELADATLEDGGHLLSGSVVSEQAQRVWKRLEGLGYKVETNPAAEAFKTPNGMELGTRGQGPVYRITRGPAGNADLPKLSDEAAALVADAEYRATSYGEDALGALNARAASARELSPLAALEKDDPNLAKTVRALIDDEDRLGSLSNTSELSNFIAEETENLKHALVEWERVRTDARWDELAPGIQRSIDEGVTANRRAPDSGFRFLQIERDSDDRIRSVLEGQGRSASAPGQLRIIDDAGTPRAGVVEPRRVSRTKGVLGGAARLDPEQLTRLNRAVQEGDAQGVGAILAEGTNMNYVLSDDNRVRNLYAELGRMYDDAGKGTKRSLEETRKRADELMADMGRSANEDPAQLERFLDEVMPGSNLPSDVKITALRTMEAMTMQRTMELTEQVLNGASNARTVAEMMQASQAALRLNDARRFLSADLARGLNAHKIPVLGEGALPPQAIMEIIREGGDPTFIAKRMRAAMQGGPDAMTSLRKELENPKMKALSGYWYASLLSGPITHMVNMGSNAGIAVLRPVEDIVGGLVEGAFKGDFRRAQEGVEAVHDLVRSLRGSFKAAAIAFDVGESQLGKAITPFDAPELASRGPLHALTEGQNGPLYSMTRAFSTVLGVPGRLLVAEDEMFRGVNYFVHARRAARRHLRQTQPNLKGSDFESQLEQLTQDARHWSEFSNRLSVEKRAELRAIHEGALNEARYNTFTNDLEYGVGKSLQTFQHNHPWFRLIMPFVRTPTNIFRFAMQRVPGAGLIQRQNRELMQAIRAGNRDAMRDLAGRQMVGMGVTMVTADMFAKGSITGAGPTDPAQREQWLTTHQPYSIRIGDEWIEYRRLEPFGMQVGLVADALTSYSELESDEQLDAAGVMAGTTASIISNLSSKRYLQGITQFLGMVSSGEPEAVKRYMLSQAGNLVPLAQLNAQTNRALVDPQLRELQNVSDSLRSRIPGLSDSVTPRINLWGEPINLPPGYRYDTLAPHHNGNITFTNGLGSLLIPAKNRSVHSTPTREWLTEIGFSLGNPSRTYWGRMRDVKLTPEQRNRWIELTNNARGSRTSMEAEIERLRTDPRVAELTDQAAVDLVRDIIRRRKFRAEGQMMKEFPELREKALEKRVQRMIRSRSDEERATELTEQMRERLAETL